MIQLSTVIECRLILTYVGNVWESCRRALLGLELE